MKLGFYYHTSISCLNGELCLPGFVGIFLEELARQCELLVLVLHEAGREENEINSYRLRAQNIEWINLGPKRPAWHRTIFHHKTLVGLEEQLNVDQFILRSPSPLAPYFRTLPRLRNRICYMVISDYSIGANNMKLDSIRNIGVYLYLKFVHWQFLRCLRGRKVVVNSKALYRSLKKVTKDLHEIRTTTLRKSDFYRRDDTCQGTAIKLLFTGRLVLEKGLAELVQAGIKLYGDFPNLEVHMVGWEEKGGRAVQNQLLALVKGTPMEGRLIFHGKKEVGNELNAIYRSADVYVIASYFEGFPRTIWEAMANSLPVVASRVGAIPDYLENGKDAMLVDPKNIGQLIGAIASIINDQELRRRLITNGLNKANRNLLDRNVQKFVALLERSS